MENQSFVLYIGGYAVLAVVCLLLNDGIHQRAYNRQHEIMDNLLLHLAALQSSNTILLALQEKHEAERKDLLQTNLDLQIQGEQLQLELYHAIEEMNEHDLEAMFGIDS